jgi:hypothetical protein
MTPEQLRTLFLWSPDTGKIFWKNQFGGREAFVSVQSKGYLYGKMEGQNYLAHRVLWALETGEWPEGEIDHINQNKRDNRFSNLRDVSRIENSRNKGLNKNNSSGCLGVSKTGSGNWRAYITVQGRQIHLGVFCNPEDAKWARLCADQQYLFSKRHGTLFLED